MDEAAALQWSKRTGKFAGYEAKFGEFVSSLSKAAIDPVLVEHDEPEEVLGRGAFGLIERAVFDGKPVAVKSLKAEVMQGPKKIDFGRSLLPSTLKLGVSDSAQTQSQPPRALLIIL